MFYLKKIVEKKLLAHTIDIFPSTSLPFLWKSHETLDSLGLPTRYFISTSSPRREFSNSKRGDQVLIARQNFRDGLTQTYIRKLNSY